MSTDQPFDPNLVEQTRLQIRAIVNEVTQLAKQDVPPEEFHAEILPKIVTALAAVGGAIWTVDDRGALTLGYQVNMRELRLGESEEATKKHSRLLYKMLMSKEDGTIVTPRSGGEGDDEAGNPTDFLLVFSPIRTELEQVGLLEIVQRADTGPVAQKGYIKFLGQMGMVTADYYKNRQLRNFSERQHLWTLLEEFTRTIHKTLDMRETAYTVVNEGRRLIECDRVSIAIQKGTKCLIESVSGQDMVDKRSTTVKLLGKLATSVVKCNEPIWYTGDTSNFAPQVEKAVEDYVDESHTKMVAVFPLTKKRLEEAPEEDITAREKPLPPFGALIVEQIEDSRIPERMKKRVEIVADHACSALGNSIDHNSVFLMPLWTMIGKSKVLTTARMLPKTISIALAILATILALIFVPWNFNLSCDGNLEPHRANVFAEIPGIIKEVYVKHDQMIEAGEVIAVCTSTQLDKDEEDLLGRISVLETELTSSLQMIDDRMMPPDRRLSLQADINRIREQQKSLDKQKAIHKRMRDQLTIRAPISGKVTEFEVERELVGRPVNNGTLLMEIVDTDRSKPWKLELDMPEKNMGHIIGYQKKMLAKDSKYLLDVDFVLVSNADINYTGKVDRIHERAEVKGEAGAAGGGNTVRMTADIDDMSKLPPEIRPGIGCKAKIKCGKRSIGYVLFHDAIAFVQQNIIFKYF